MYYCGQQKHVKFRFSIVWFASNLRTRRNPSLWYIQALTRVVPGGFALGEGLFKIRSFAGGVFIVYPFDVTRSRG